MCIDGEIYLYLMYEEQDEGVESPGTGVIGVMSHLIWVQGNKLRSLARAADALNCRTVSPS